MLIYVDARLREWAMWKAGAGGRGYDLSNGGGGNEGPISYIPVDDLRCAEVDWCVCALMPLLRQAVEETYLRIGGTEQAAERCQCGRVTLWRRVSDAHVQLLGFMNDLAAGVTVKPWEERARELLTA
jgi:hypothetical protein